MSENLLSLYKYYFIESFQQPREADATITSILQMAELWHGEVKQLAQGCAVRKCWRQYGSRSVVLSTKETY